MRKAQQRAKKATVYSEAMATSTTTPKALHRHTNYSTEQEHVYQRQVGTRSYFEVPATLSQPSTEHEPGTLCEEPGDEIDGSWMDPSYVREQVDELDEPTKRHRTLATVSISFQFRSITGII